MGCEVVQNRQVRGSETVFVSLLLLVALLALTQKSSNTGAAYALGDCCNSGHCVRRIDSRRRQHELCLRQFVWPNASGILRLRRRLRLCRHPQGGGPHRRR